jgi:hypothetical protein
MEEKHMKDLTPYEKLQVSEGASFEEVQAARDKLVKLNENDESQRELVEAAYDAVLMDRLRQRQEGKIKVPERIRFAERRQEESAPKAVIAALSPRQTWLPQFLERPTPVAILVPTGLFGGLSAMTLYTSMGLTKTSDLKQLEPLSNSLAFLLALGVIFSICWLNRKEQRLGRSFWMTLVGLLVAAAIGAALWQMANPFLPNLPAVTLVTILIFLVLWFLTSFCR